jgi:hypothetical protein
LYVAGFVQVNLVIRIGGSRRHEAHRPAACRPEVHFMREPIEAFERALGPQALEPGPHRVEDRVT